MGILCPSKISTLKSSLPLLHFRNHDANDKWNSHLYKILGKTSNAKTRITVRRKTFIRDIARRQTGSLTVHKHFPSLGLNKPFSKKRRLLQLEDPIPSSESNYNYNLLFLFWMRPPFMELPDQYLAYDILNAMVPLTPKTKMAASAAIEH